MLTTSPGSILFFRDVNCFYVTLPQFEPFDDEYFMALNMQDETIARLPKDEDRLAPHSYATMISVLGKLPRCIFTARISGVDRSVSVLLLPPNYQLDIFARLPNTLTYMLMENVDADNPLGSIHRINKSHVV